MANIRRTLTPSTPAGSRPVTELNVSTGSATIGVEMPSASMVSLSATRATGMSSLAASIEMTSTHLIVIAKLRRLFLDEDKRGRMVAFESCEWIAQ